VSEKPIGLCGQRLGRHIRCRPGSPANAVVPVRPMVTKVNAVLAERAGCGYPRSNWGQGRGPGKSWRDRLDYALLLGVIVLF
jgi:hypothetical protein